MMNRRIHNTISIFPMAALALALVPAGCTKEAPPPPPPPAPKQTVAPPPRPVAKSVEQLMTELGIDDRIVLPEARAPETTQARVAVLEFFDAMARGDDKALSSMLSEADKDALNELVESGVWSETTAHIRRVEIQTGQSPAGEPAALAVIEVALPDVTSYEPQLWYYVPDVSGAYSWIAVATPPGIMNELSGDDWIAAWHRLLEEDLALADKPDEKIDDKQIGSDEEEDGGGAESPGGGPGGPNRLRGKPATPRTPPRP